MRFFEKKDDDEYDVDGDSGESFSDVYNTGRGSAKGRVAPDGINPNPLEYMIIEDNGVKVYTTVLYVYALPRTDTFVKTFEGLFNFTGVESSVHIEPVDAHTASRILNKRVVSLEAELISAKRGGDTNRIRKVNEEYTDAQTWAREIESGFNSIFYVSFMYVISDTELKALNSKITDFVYKARERNIELSNAYSVVPEAYLCAGPYNRMFDYNVGPFKKRVIKKFVLDRSSLANIYNHTSFHFSHKNGVFFGHELHTGLPFYYDAFDAAHNGYSVIVTGSTGSGKSTMVKGLLSRNMDFGDKVVCIDYDSVTGEGEYSALTRAEGGVVYKFSVNSRNVLNPFELYEEIEFDTKSGEEYVALHLADKISDCTHIIMLMLVSGKGKADFATETFLEDKISEICSEMYAERGIVDGVPESLYTDGQVVRDGQVVSGKARKSMPTLSEFYLRALRLQRRNHDRIYDKTWAIIVSGLKGYVRELHYDSESFERITPKIFRTLDNDEGGVYRITRDGRKRYVHTIIGTKPYFDGRSTADAGFSAPMTDFDISQLPEEDRFVAQQVVMSFVREGFIKKNSANPNNIQKLYVVVDEAHKGFVYEPARQFLQDAYRCGRKHNVSIVSMTQKLSDYSAYKETMDMLGNTTSVFLFRQPYQDREFLLANTPLTEVQVDELVNLGGDSLALSESGVSRRGEVCLIDNGLSVFLKFDVLWESELPYVTTDADNQRKLYAKTQDRG